MNFFKFSYQKFTALTGTFAAASASILTSSNNVEKKQNFIPYLLIGGGTASYYAALTIRARDPDARVLIVTDEKESPYNRPPLSKEIWWYHDSKTPETLSYVGLSGRRRDIRFEADGFYPKLENFNDYKHGGIALLRNKKVVKINSQKRFVELEDGNKIEFDKCLIATGSNFKTLPELNCEKFKNFVTILKNIDDYRNLYSILQKPSTKRIAIIGDNIISTELAYSLNRRYGQIAMRNNFENNNKNSPIEIYQIVPKSTILLNILPKVLSEYSTQKMQQIGVKILTNYSIKTANLLSSNNKDETKISLQLINDDNSTVKTIEFDHIILALDNEPNVLLAQNSKLDLDEGGVKANDKMQINDCVWAAGDVCSFEDKVLKCRRLVKNWENAQVTGRVAGENMTGGEKAYSHQAGFYTIYGVGDHINAVGEINPNRYNTVTFLFKQSNENSENDQLKSIVFYLTDDRQIVGILLLNIYGYGIEIARKIINDGNQHKSNKELEDLTKLFDVFNEKVFDDENEVEDETKKVQ